MALILADDQDGHGNNDDLDSAPNAADRAPTNDDYQ
jgi:hypothetical protein